MKIRFSTIPIVFFFLCVFASLREASSFFPPVPRVPHVCQETIQTISVYRYDDHPMIDCYTTRRLHRYCNACLVEGEPGTVLGGYETDFLFSHLGQDITGFDSTVKYSADWHQEIPYSEFHKFLRVDLKPYRL